MTRVIEFLEKNQSDRPSGWREQAQWRRDNASWLSYSRMIALKVLARMDELNVTQVQLAKRMGCSQQHVSTLLKGSSNMTLETISKLEDALQMNIFRSATSASTGYPVISQERKYLCDSDVVPSYGSEKHRQE